MLAAVCGGLHTSVSDAAVAMVRHDDAVVPERAAVDAYGTVYQSWRAGRASVEAGA